MRKFTLLAASAAAVISLGAAKPAHAVDPVTAGVILKLGIAAAIISSRNNTREAGTSVNTHYALTGQGRPYLSNGHLAGPPLKRHTTKIVCDAHGHHCHEVHVHHDW